MKRDRIYEVVLAMVLISLGFGMGKFLPAAFDKPHDSHLWFVVIADAVAVFGVMWLLRDYLRRLKTSIIMEAGKLGVTPSVYEIAVRIYPLMRQKKMKVDNDADGVAVVLKALMAKSANDEKLAKARRNK
jgi:hypothetical protein